MLHMLLLIVLTKTFIWGLVIGFFIFCWILSKINDNKPCSYSVIPFERYFCYSSITNSMVTDEWEYDWDRRIDRKKYPIPHMIMIPLIALTNIGDKISEDNDWHQKNHKGLRAITGGVITMITCLIFMSSCTGNNQRRINSEGNTPREEATKKITGNSGMIREVYEFNYDGCDYISFEGNTADKGFSVIHSPKCKNSECPYKKN